MEWFNRSRVSLWLIGSLLVTLILASRTQAEFMYGDPVKVSQLYSPYGDSNTQISPDGLELYFVSNRPKDGESFKYDIWVASRASIENDWDSPERLPDSINTENGEFTPCLSSDGLTLYFGAKVADNVDLWFSTRASLESPWSERINLGNTINTEFGEDGPHLSADGLSLYFNSGRPGGFGKNDIYVSTRPSKADPWEPPVNLGENVNSSQYDIYPFISPDGLALFFSRGPGWNNKCYVCRRESQKHAWGPAVEFSPVNMPGRGIQNFSFSSEGSTLYFVGYTNYFDPSTFDTWQVEVTPMVDLNGDGQVEVQDVTFMTEHWGQDDPLCDISPLPMGDGIVDKGDLEVLTDNMLPIDRTVLAHWALDELAGNVAHDSAYRFDAAVLGDALWQPENGQVDGALALDGINDYMETPYVLNPEQGSFSVFAWIKGGAPGQVVLSQADGADWLLADGTAGNLQTDLKGKGRGWDPSLHSDALITDGNWHHIGLVWDDGYRRLYVDGQSVAMDAIRRNNFPDNAGNLYIGAANDRHANTLWSGLVDDVRIYNRAVKP